MPRVVSWSIAAFSLLFGALTSAEEERIHLDYRAAEGCPSRAEFLAEVRARTPLAQSILVDDVALPHKLIVVASHTTDGGASGSLMNVQGDLRGTPRQVAADRCGTVTSALALITALAVDPNASTVPYRPPPNSAPSAPDVPSASPGLPTPLPAPSVPAPTFVQTPSSQRHNVIASSEPRGNVLRLGAHAVGMLWSSDSIAAIGGVGASLQWETRRSGWWSPSVRLGGEIATSTAVVPDGAGGARATFLLSTASLQMCPAHVRLTSQWSVQACAGVEGGVVSARGTTSAIIVHSGRETRPWWALHQTVRVQLEMSDRWQGGLEVGVVEPLQRDEFVFESPRVPICTMPYVGPVVRIGLAYRFW